MVVPSADAHLSPELKLWRVGWLVLVGGVLVWTRLVGLDQSLWHDEAYTALSFINQGPDEILWGEYASNNHELFNLFAWATTSVLGDSEPFYRLWSVVPAIAAVALFTWWAWRRLDPWIAVAFGLFITVSPLELDLTKQARGYGLATLAAVGMFVAADSASRTRSPRALAAFGGLGVVGLWTLPMLSLAFVAQAGVLLAEPSLRRKVMVTVAIAAIAAGGFYAPHLRGIFNSAGDHYLAKAPGAACGASAADRIAGLDRRCSPGWRGLVKRPIGLVAPDTKLVLTGNYAARCGETCFSGVALIVYGGIAAVLMLIGAISLWRREMRYPVALLVAPPALTVVVLTLLRYSAEDRLVSFLAPYLLMLAAIGLWRLGASLGRRRSLGPAVAVAGVLLALVGTVRIVRLADELDRLPRENFKQVGAIVNGSHIRRVVTNSVRRTGLVYYIPHTPVEHLRTDALQRVFCETRLPVVYIDHPLFTWRADTGCLRRRGAAVVRVRQRDRGQHIDVWLLQPASGPVGSG